MTCDAISTVGKCRELLSAGAGGAADVGTTARAAALLAPFQDMPQLQLLRQMIVENRRESETLFALASAPQARLIVGFFDIPYIPEARLEALAFRPVAIPDAILDRVPFSQARPVLVEASTVGLTSSPCVTLFPENFVGVVPQTDQPAFYFINRFLVRLKEVTLPYLAEFWDKQGFIALRRASDDALYSAFAIWVHLHEAFHRTGAFPLPAHLKLKSTRNAAAFEELRVDILALKTLAELMPGAPELQLCFELILAERIIRYPIQYAADDNFDARASIALCERLRLDGLLVDRANSARAAFARDDLGSYFATLAGSMAAVETGLADASFADRRAGLARYITDLAQENGDWKRLALFERARGALARALVA